MFAIDVDSVKNWINANGKWAPQSVTVFCPHCGERGTFFIQSPNYFDNMDAAWGKTGCPTCGEVVQFLAYSPGSADDRSKMTCACLAMYPPPLLPRQPVEGYTLVPDPIRKAYMEAIKTFNAGVPNAAGAACGRVLEGVIEHLKSTGTPEDLQAHLKEVLSEPAIEIAKVVKKGRNIGAHFDPEKEHDPDSAKAMLDLVDHLLSYLFALPMMIMDMEWRLMGLKRSGDED